MACATVALGIRDRVMKTYVKNTNQSTKIIDENKTGSMVDRMVAYTSDQVKKISIFWHKPMKL